MNVRGDRPINVDDLVQRIREGIRTAERDRGKRRELVERLPSFPSLRDTQELRDLNRAWILEPAAPIRSHRAVVGPAIVAAKRQLQGAVVAVLEGYFHQERTFLSTLVRYLNRLTEHVERLAGAAQQNDELLVKRTEELLQKMLEEQRALESTVEDLRAEVARLRAERAEVRRPPAAVRETAPAPCRPGEADRGRYGLYASALAGSGPALHVLAGRGDLLVALGEIDVEGRGIEPDPGARDVAVSRGATIVDENELESANLGAVALTDTERLSEEALLAWFRRARDLLRPDGLLLVETPNPGSHGGLVRRSLGRPDGLSPELPDLVALVESAGFVDVRGDLSASTEPGIELPGKTLRSEVHKIYAENFRRLEQQVLAPPYQYVIGRQRSE